MPESSPPRGDVAARLDGWVLRVDRVLAGALDAAPPVDATLRAAMRHAVLLGGKRMRPLLVYATGTAFGAREATLDAAAAAVELIHAYSLVHDDLPAMDDDALRRGQPTVHVAHGEAAAILAGDALQSLAFSLLAGADVDPGTTLAMLRELADAAGASGMCGGQALDLASTGGAHYTDGVHRGSTTVARASANPTGGAALAALERLHALKTGALLVASVRLGAIAANVDAANRAHLDAFAAALGLAFQIRDDLLDIEGDSATLGKTPGKDVAQSKATFPALIGADASRARLRDLAHQMHDALAPFGGSAATLAALASRVVDRHH